MEQHRKSPFLFINTLYSMDKQNPLLAEHAIYHIQSTQNKIDLQYLI